MDLTMLGYCVYKFNKLLRETGSTTPLQLRGNFFHLKHFCNLKYSIRSFSSQFKEKSSNNVYLKLEVQPLYD